MTPRRVRVALILGATATLLVLASLLLAPPSLERHARDVIAACADSAYAPACYDAEIPRLMDRGLSMEEAFTVVSLVTELAKDAPYSYYFCHVVAHRLSAKETAKDPAGWADVLTRCPTNVCANGCLHGAAQERYRADVLTSDERVEAIPELRAACPKPGEGGPTMLEHAFCRHALGHLAVYATGGDIPSSLELCNEVTKGETLHALRTCYKGVFMQVYQPLDPEDIALLHGVAPQNPEAVDAYCAQFEGAAHSACTVESWPLYGAERLSSPDELLSFCAKTPGEIWENRCLSDLVSALNTVSDYDTAAIDRVCSGLPGDTKAGCYAHAAGTALIVDSRLVPTSVALCKIAEEEGVGDRCYEELLFYSAYAFSKGSDAFSTLCAALPPAYSARCVAGEGAALVSDIIGWTP